MKLTIKDVKTLNVVGKTLLKVVEKKNTMPVLAHVLLDAQKGDVKIMATNLETSIRVDITNLVDLEQTGAVCIPAKQFFTCLKGKKTEIEISAEADKEGAVWADVGTFKIACLPSSDYPAWLQDKPIGIGSISGLSERLKKVSYAAGDSDTRYALKGIYFDLIEGNLVATDGHRMALTPSGLLGLEAFIVPLKSMKVVEGIKVDPEISLAGFDENLEPKYIIFSYPGIEILSRIIDGTYPKYLNVAPKEFTANFTVQAERFKEKLHDASTITRARSNMVSIYHRGEDLVIYAKNPDIGEAREALPCRAAGDSLTAFAINASYLSDVLATMNSDTVTLDLTGEMSPLRIQDGETGHVLMPMRDVAFADGDKLFVKFSKEIIQKMRLTRKIEKARKRPDINISALSKAA